MAYWRDIACAGVMAMAASPLAGAHPGSAADALSGAWARTLEECQEPELIFSADALKIAFEVDGEPATFAYPNVHYEEKGRQVKVDLGRPHPYSKTPEKKTLRFDRIDSNSIALIRSRGRHARFLRCPE